MATIKSFTSLEQSKKLAEILPLESADMSWVSNGLGKPFARNIPIKGDPEELCACWSLAALLDVIKDKVIFGGNSPEGWFCCYTIKKPTKTLTIYEDSLVDACYEMIIRLNELNLF